MKAIIASLILSAMCSVSIAAPSVESYLPAIESLSSANDERGSEFTGEIVQTLEINSEKGVHQVAVVHVTAKERVSEKKGSALKPYAKDIYILTVGAYAGLISIQFSERILLGN